MSSSAGRRPTSVLPEDVAAVVVLARDGVEVASWPLEVRGGVDLSVVDDLARLQLAARRLGCSIKLRDPSGELTALLAFLGLARAISGSTGAVLQVVGEAECGEERGVEEVVVPDDPVA
ncbi:MAG: hypothetical protein QOG82_1881 [Actinomycetota bacterium]|jgi:hypothetical protein|nr:hypothetical protein [Actinomycetota bacterium]